MNGHAKYLRLYADLLIVRARLRTNPNTESLFLLTDTQTDQMMYRIFQFDPKQRGTFTRIPQTIRNWQQTWQIREAFLKITTVPIPKDLQQGPELPFCAWYQPLLRQHVTKCGLPSKTQELQLDPTTTTIIHLDATVLLDKCCTVFGPPAAIIPIPSSYDVSPGQLVSLQINTKDAAVDAEGHPGVTRNYTCLYVLGPRVHDYFVARRTIWQHLFCFLEDSYTFYIVIKRKLFGFDHEIPTQRLAKAYVDKPDPDTADMDNSPDPMEIPEVRRIQSCQQCSCIYVLCGPGIRRTIPNLHHHPTYLTLRRNHHINPSLY